MRRDVSGPDQTPTARPARRITWRVIPYVFLPIIFVTLGGVGIYNAAQELRERSYISVAGESVEADIVLVRERTRDTPARSGSGNRWLLDVTYRYEIDGRSYENNRIGLREFFAPAEDMNPPAWLNDLAAQYATGQKIDVWVSPDNPTNSALVRTTGTWIAPILIALASFAAFLLIWKSTGRRPVV